MAENLEEKIRILSNWINESNRIVFFGGAGVSTESGIKDFRSEDGLYNEQRRTNLHGSTESGIPDFRSVDGLYNQTYDEPPETILSHTYFERYTEKFYRFYRDKMLFLDAQPNAAHKKLAELEAADKLTAVVTQNIDGLHQAAGSKAVFELHGSVHRNYCTRCSKFHPVGAVKDSAGIPRCSCGGVIKPDVVLYEEALDQDCISGAIHHIRQADMLIIGGTSLAVYPAAGLIHYYRGNKLVLINKSPTPYDGNADLVISGPIGQIMSQIKVN